MKANVVLGRLTVLFDLHPELVAGHLLSMLLLSTSSHWTAVPARGPGRSGQPGGAS